MNDPDKNLLMQGNAAGLLKQQARHLAGQNQLDRAMALCEEALRNRQDDADTWELLGSIQQRRGDLAGAMTSYHRAVQIEPGRITALHAMAVITDADGNPGEAEKYYHEALRQQPNNPVLNYNMGCYLHRQSRAEEALTHYRRATASKPDFPQAHNNTGIILAALGRPEESIASYRAALAAAPDFVDAHNNLGAVLTDSGRIEEALDCFHAALLAQPDNPDTHDRLATTLSYQGKHAEAVRHYRHALGVAPDNPAIHSNLLLCLNYMQETSPADLFNEHVSWGRRFRNVERSHVEAVQPRNPAQKLRVGYVSPDFYSHAVSHFIEPVLANHNANDFETYCYSDTHTFDETTCRLRSLAAHWRDILGKTTAQAADIIRNDRIDILVDLAGHTGFNRLPVFAERAAPVQITWLGYPATTGLTAIDYRLTDSEADPDGQEEFHTEELIRIPGSFLCYRPPREITISPQPPMMTSGHVTFASFNHLPKITADTIGLWARILHDVPGARLMLKNKSFRDRSTREYCASIFNRHGIPTSRIDLIGWLADPAEHLSMYRHVDIALDTYPYNGTTTTCEALWMGVPVVTLVGERHASRVGLSLLSRIGLTELAARNAEDYLKTAVELADNPGRLMSMRQSLRTRLLKSNLLDASSFTRRLESIYMNICARRTNHSAR